VHLSQGTRSVCWSVHGAVRLINAAARPIFLEAVMASVEFPMYDALPRINQGRLSRILPDSSMHRNRCLYGFPPGTARVKKTGLLLDF